MLVGEFDRAMTELEDAYDKRTAGMVLLQMDPAFDPLRAHPRFEPLLRRIAG